MHVKVYINAYLTLSLSFSLYVHVCGRELHYQKTGDARKYTDPHTHTHTHGYTHTHTHGYTQTHTHGFTHYITHTCTHNKTPNDHKHFECSHKHRPEFLKMPQH